MKDLKYIIKRIIIGTGIALALMLIRSNVFAETIGVEYEPSQVVSYANISNANSNITNTKTSIQSGGNLYFWRYESGLQKHRLTYTFTGVTGSYDLQFVTYDGEDSYTANVIVNSISYNCSYSSSDFSYINGSVGFSQSIGYQLFTCKNINFTNNGVFNIYLNGNFFDSTGNMKRYFMISKRFTLTNIITNQEIIDNQNQNTQEQIDSQKVCNNIDINSIKTSGIYLNSQGSEVSNSNFGITDYIQINKATINVTINRPTGYGSLCFYNVNKTLISCIDNNTLQKGILTIPNNSYYVRFSIHKLENKPQFEICTDGNQAITDSQKQLNDTLNSDNTPDSGATSTAYDDFNDYVATNGVITSLVLLPVNLFTNVLTSLNSSCFRFSLGSLLGTPIYFDCIDPSDFLGSTLWNVIDVLCSGFFVYHIAQKFIKVFHNLTQLKDGDPIGD